MSQTQRTDGFSFACNLILPSGYQSHRLLGQILSRMYREDVSNPKHLVVCILLNYDVRNK